MPIMVVFESADTACNPGTGSLECGPYRVAQIVGDSLYAMDGYQPFVLANRESGGWRVNGLPEPLFPSIRFVPPPDQRRAELAEVA